MKRSKVLISLISVLLGFVVGAVIMLIANYNPFLAYGKMFQGALGSLSRLGMAITVMTPLILTGLSVLFGMRTGLFNIGASGQLLMGGFAAVMVGVLLDTSRVPHVILAVVAAILAGALWGLIPGLLKALFNVHEVVTSIMTNWIAVWTIYYLVPLCIPGQYNTESAIISKSASLRTEWLTNLFPGSPINLGIFFALISVLIVWFILDKTKFGYELKAVGFNRDAADYAGMKVKSNIIYSMTISGALAGLAGATYYLGYTDNMKIGELPGLGFDGIAVALLGMNHPVGALLAAILFGVMRAGSGFMSASTNVPPELVPVVIAIIIFFAAAQYMITQGLGKFEKWFPALANKKIIQQNGKEVKK